MEGNQKKCPDKFKILGEEKERELKRRTLFLEGGIRKELETALRPEHQESNTTEVNRGRMLAEANRQGCTVSIAWLIAILEDENFSDQHQELIKKDLYRSDLIDLLPFLKDLVACENLEAYRNFRKQQHMSYGQDGYGANDNLRFASLQRVRENFQRIMEQARDLISFEEGSFDRKKILLAFLKGISSKYLFWLSPLNSGSSVDYENDFGEKIDFKSQMHQFGGNFYRDSYNHISGVSAPKYLIGFPRLAVDRDGDVKRKLFTPTAISEKELMEIVPEWFDTEIMPSSTMVDDRNQSLTYEARLFTKNKKYTIWQGRKIDKQAYLNSEKVREVKQKKLVSDLMDKTKNPSSFSYPSEDLKKVIEGNCVNARINSQVYLQSGLDIFQPTLQNLEEWYSHRIGQAISLPELIIENIKIPEPDYVRIKEIFSTPEEEIEYNGRKIKVKTELVYLEQDEQILAQGFRRGTIEDAELLMGKKPSEFFKMPVYFPGTSREGEQTIYAANFADIDVEVIQVPCIFENKGKCYMDWFPLEQPIVKPGYIGNRCAYVKLEK